MDSLIKECIPDDILASVKRGKAIVATAYHLTRRKATEVMVWVLTNKDRNSSLEIHCSLPIAYGLRTIKCQQKKCEMLLSTY